ncbi:MAG: hypothetical protein ABIO55_12865 [Ginsengibacter sp.]
MNITKIALRKYKGQLAGHLKENNFHSIAPNRFARINIVNQAHLALVSYYFFLLQKVYFCAL